ncbi:MAG TPA: GNAT family protein [Chitinophagaceae bacterium]
METVAEHTSIVLETRRIRLRETQDKDIVTIHDWRNSEKFRLLVHYNTDEISYEDFHEEFIRETEYYKYRLIIERVENEQPIGLIYVDTFSEQYRSCFINLFIAEPFEKKGYGVDAFVVFVLFLFRQEQLKKLFANAFDFNHHSMSCMKNLGMKELIGNVTKVVRRGEEQSIVCYAADENIVPRLERICQYLSGVIKYQSQPTILASESFHQQ